MTGAMTTSNIMTAWETGVGRGPLDRAIALLWAAGERADLADLPLAERDRRLLKLRQATFGTPLVAVTHCPDCETQVEIGLDTTDLAGALAAPETETIDIDGTKVELRALTSRDLAEAADVPEVDIASFVRDRLTSGADDLTPATAARIDTLIEEREAAGELSVLLTCADCGAGWTDQLDVVAHMWTEVEAAAHRIMMDVAEIAAAFGWSEAEILSMSEARRSTYLRIARGG